MAAKGMVTLLLQDISIELDTRFATDYNGFLVPTVENINLSLGETSITITGGVL